MSEEKKDPWARQAELPGAVWRAWADYKDALDNKRQ